MMRRGNAEIEIGFLSVWLGIGYEEERIDVEIVLRLLGLIEVCNVLGESRTYVWSFWYSELSNSLVQTYKHTEYQNLQSTWTSVRLDVNTYNLLTYNPHPYEV